MKLRLIKHWRLGHRFWVVQLAALLSALSAIQANVIPNLAPLLPPHRFAQVTAGIATLIILVRFVRQSLGVDDGEQT